MPWFIVLVSFSYYLYYLLWTKSLYKFIHPRMTIYIIFALVVLIALSILQLIKVLRKSHDLCKPSIVFVLPIALFYAVNPQGLNSDIVSTKGISTTAYHTVSHASNLVNTINITASNFNDKIDELTYNASKYKGKQITVSGFIYRNSNFPKDTFDVARMIIVCCAADAEINGIACHLTSSFDFKDDQWVSIKGTLATIKNFVPNDIDSNILPIINVTSIKTISKPINPYIYLKKI